MKKKMDLLVFDLDGTLVRSGDDIVFAVNYALQELGVPARSAETIKGFVGDGIKALLVRSLGPHSVEYLDKAMNLFSTYYSSHLLDNTTLYPYVPELLEHFRSKKKVIITNKREEYAIRIIKGLGIDRYFLDIIGEDTTPFKKPDQRLLQQVMERWEVAPEETIVIGDGINDILLARNGQAVSCAFLGGLTEREKLCSLCPHMTCERLSELMLLIE